MSISLYKMMKWVIRPVLEYLKRKDESILKTAKQNGISGSTVLKWHLITLKFHTRLKDMICDFALAPWKWS